MTLCLMWCSEGFLPDKAIDVIDEAGAKAQLTQNQNSCKKVTAIDIHYINSTRIGIPIEKLSEVLDDNGDDDGSGDDVLVMEIWYIDRSLFYFYFFFTSFLF